MAHKPHEAQVVNEPQGRAVLHKFVHEPQAQNTDDIRLWRMIWTIDLDQEATTTIFTIDLDQEATTTIFVHAVNQCTTTLVSIQFCSYNSGDELLHYMLTQHSVKKGKYLVKQAFLLLCMN